MFGCAWKINFPENIFSWLCVLMALTQKLVSVKIFTSNNFRTYAQRERERERGRRESPDHAFDCTGEPRAQITPRTHSPDHAFDFVDLRTDLRTHEPIFDLEPLTHEPSTSPTTQSLCATNPRIDLSLCVILIFCVILIDPWTDLRFCVIFIFYSLFDLWFCCCCCGGVGSGVLVVFLLCGGGFCVGGGRK